MMTHRERPPTVAEMNRPFVIVTLALILIIAIAALSIALSQKHEKLGHVYMPTHVERGAGR